MKNKLRSLFKTSYLEIVLIIFTFSFSVFLMFFTFHKEDGTLFIASKAWSDFGSHLPLIRSFSFGSNFPPEYPLFPGQPINYHFLFYFLVGLIEKAGIPIKHNNIYFQCAAISKDEAKAIFSLTTIHADIPEPIRIAHLIAAGITKGESSGDA